MANNTLGIKIYFSFLSFSVGRSLLMVDIIRGKILSWYRSAVREVECSSELRVVAAQSIYIVNRNIFQKKILFLITELDHKTGSFQIFRFCDY